MHPPCDKLTASQGLYVCVLCARSASHRIFCEWGWSHIECSRSDERRGGLLILASSSSTPRHVGVLPRAHAHSWEPQISSWGRSCGLAHPGCWGLPLVGAGPHSLQDLVVLPTRGGLALAICICSLRPAAR